MREREYLCRDGVGEKRGKQTEKEREEKEIDYERKREKQRK